MSEPQPPPEFLTYKDMYGALVATRLGEGQAQSLLGLLNVIVDSVWPGVRLTIPKAPTPTTPGVIVLAFPPGRRMPHPPADLKMVLQKAIGTITWEPPSPPLRSFDDIWTS